MANPGAGSLTGLRDVEGWALVRALGETARATIASDVRGWLRWQDTLSGWKPQKSRVSAVPFVAIYDGSKLRGCIGSGEGGTKENLTRAFLSAVADTRFGGIRREARARLACEISFLRSLRAVDAEKLAGTFEAGTHGIGLRRDGGTPIFLLPSVARDGGLDAKGMLDALHRKAGKSVGVHFVFEVETVVVRRERALQDKGSPQGMAAAWLASLVNGDGSLTFAIDARTGATSAVGKMHHARSAAVIQALAASGGHRALVTKARARLVADIRQALAGQDVVGWPAHPAEVAGTLAHALRAGAELRAEALAFASGHEAAIAGVPWHAAQVVAALGRSAPPALWAACTRDLSRQPWAPWTVLAFIARGESGNATQAAADLVEAIRAEPPYIGAVMVTKHPEVAITALTVEALSHHPRVPGAREAIRRARAFLLSNQLTRGRIPAPYDTTLSAGAFVAAPTSSLLRGDVTAHALLALG
jgi:AMMECR1 domain-containing protein